jgi:DNA primase
LVSRRVIQDILDRVKIEDVVGGYVTLKRSGNSLKGLCPFHGETSPSFHVSPSKGVYYCFGCRAGGNAVKFLQEIEGKSFIDVIRELAEKEGIPIPEEELGGEFEKKEKERYARRRRHLELLKAAAGLYEKCLWKSPAGKKGRLYLESRGITEETARTFRLGFAPEGGAGIGALLRSMGASSQDAEDVGLLRRGRDGSLYELFRSRIVFPIVVPGGNVAAFSARALPGTEEEKVKYINSPDSPYFHKGEILFGLAQALPAIRKSGSVILVEGNFDIISMVQAGFGSAVAPLGSALTARHVETLRRLGARIILLFDGDEAGVRASYRAFEVIVPAGISTRIALLPAGEDPHSLLISGGRRAMEKVLEGSRDMIGFVIDEKARQAGDSDIERVKALRGLWDLLRQTPDDLVRGEILRKLPQAFRIGEREVKNQLGFREGAAAAPGPASAGSAASPGSIRKEFEVILGAAADFPSIAAEIYSAGKDVLDDFSVQRILHEIAVAGESGREGEGVALDVALIAQTIQDEVLRDWFMRRAVGGAQFDGEEEARKAALDSLEKLSKGKIDREIKSRAEKAKEAWEKDGDSPEYRKMLSEKEKLNRRAKKIMY